MMVTLLKSKIHRAKVTQKEINYEGSIGIDKKLIDAAKLNLFERVEIYNITNGERFSTYVIEGKDGEISLNGAAARLVEVGDLIIIASYCIVDENEVKNYKPIIVLLDKDNEIIEK